MIRSWLRNYDMRFGDHHPSPDLLDARQVAGELTKRSTRVSLTFRRVRDPEIACMCDFEERCDREIPVATATYLKKPIDGGTG